MDLRLNEPMKRYYQLIYDSMKSHGLGEVASQIVAVVNLSKDELTMDVLVENTNYSLASISNAVKMLSSLHLIEVFRKPGSKKLYIKNKNCGIKLVSDKIKNTLFIENQKQLMELPKIKKDLKVLLKNAKSDSQKKLIKDEIDLISKKITEAEIVSEIIDIIRAVLKKRGVMD